LFVAFRTIGKYAHYPMVASITLTIVRTLSYINNIFFSVSVNKTTTWQNPRVTSGDQKKYSNPGSQFDARETETEKISFAGSASEI
jgi:hypothetical protein